MLNILLIIAGIILLILSIVKAPVKSSSDNESKIEKFIPYLISFILILIGLFVIFTHFREIKWHREIDSNNCSYYASESKKDFLMITLIDKKVYDNASLKEYSEVNESKVSVRKEKLTKKDINDINKYMSSFIKYINLPYFHANLVHTKIKRGEVIQSFYYVQYDQNKKEALNFQNKKLVVTTKNVN